MIFPFRRKTPPPTPAPAAAAPTPVLAKDPEFDWAQAESLLGDDPQKVPQDIADILVELVVGAAGQIKELQGKNIENERGAIGSLAHQLRGSLLNFGFTEVGDVLLKIERGSYSAAEYPGLIAQADAAFLASKKLLSDRYPTIRFP